jgi:hypothetical protein
MGPEGNSAAKFLEAMKKLMKQDEKVTGQPVFVSGLKRVVVESEDDIFAMYRNSVFCPCFRGNTPAQKCFFDVLLSTCIPVVLEYEKYHEKGYPTYFREILI